MKTNPQAAKRLEPLLNGEKLIWAEEIEIPREGEGCLVFGGLVVVLATLISLLNGSVGMGIIFAFFSVLLLSAFFRALPIAAIGLSDKYIFMKYPSFERVIPLKKVDEIKLVKGRGTQKADVKIKTKVKKLDTESYKFKIEEREYIVKNIPDYHNVIDLMNDVHLRYLSLNPPSSSDIEIE